jgi:hypothetical protein
MFIDDATHIMCNKLQIIWTCSFRDDFNNFSKSEGRFAHGGLVFCHEQFL